MRTKRGRLGVNLDHIAFIKKSRDTLYPSLADAVKIAEDAGIQALTMHGRTRACLYMGDAEYDTIASVKEKITIPLIANGDITTPEKAKFVLKYTGADDSSEVTTNPLLVYC